jgi:hypothetical protein
MFDSASSVSETEMQVVDLRNDGDFMARLIRPREMTIEISGIQRLANVFAQRPERILQELVGVSVQMCSADSSGVTIEETLGNGETQFRWIATAGKYADFLDAVLPRFYSPCGTCLDRGRPQLFRVPKPYLDLIGVDAPPVTDGILIPWEVDGTRAPYGCWPTVRINGLIAKITACCEVFLISQPSPSGTNGSRRHC